MRALYSRLRREGVDVWLDKEKLLPGADWEYEIRKAVREADVVVVCLSTQFNQAGFRQKEVRIALDSAMEKPEGEIFIIPARLEECDTLERLEKWHWVDLFESDGFQRLMMALRLRAERIGASLRIRRTAPRPKSSEPEAKAQAGQEQVEREIAEIAAREQAERDAFEKARLEAEELARQRAAQEQADLEAAERAAREKAEQDAIERARLEAWKLERQKASREEIGREAAKSSRPKKITPSRKRNTAILMRKDIFWSNVASRGCAVVFCSFGCAGGDIACSGAIMPPKNIRMLMVAMILICAFFIM